MSCTLPRLSKTPSEIFESKFYLREHTMYNKCIVRHFFLNVTSYIIKDVFRKWSSEEVFRLSNGRLKNKQQKRKILANV